MGNWKKKKGRSHWLQSHQAPAGPSPWIPWPASHSRTQQRSPPVANLQQRCAPDQTAETTEMLTEWLCHGLSPSTQWTSPMRGQYDALWREEFWNPSIQVSYWISYLLWPWWAHIACPCLTRELLLSWPWEGQPTLPPQPEMKNRTVWILLWNNSWNFV